MIQSPSISGELTATKILSGLSTSNASRRSRGHQYHQRAQQQRHARAHQVRKPRQHHNTPPTKVLHKQLICHFTTTLAACSTRVLSHGPSSWPQASPVPCQSSPTNGKRRILSAPDSHQTLPPPSAQRWEHHALGPRLHGSIQQKYISWTLLAHHL